MLQAILGDLLASRIASESNVRLTAKETEMLKRTAVGKTYGEIGLILSIDQRTVEFHIVNAMRKLNSNNKAEATMKTYAIGLLNWINTSSPNKAAAQASGHSPNGRIVFAPVAWAQPFHRQRFPAAPFAIAPILLLSGILVQLSERLVNRPKNRTESMLHTYNS